MKKGLQFIVRFLYCASVHEKINMLKIDDPFTKPELFKFVLMELIETSAA
jgi:hypothetical protein